LVINKKDIIIIGAHPNHPKKMEMLRECIERVKPLGYDILVASHYPIPTDIQEIVDYVIYDKENIQMLYSCPDYTFANNEFTIKKHGGHGGHALAVVKNINNGINYVNYLKYQFFFYMECDNLFGSDDLFKIDVLKNSMFMEKKNMVLFYSNIEDEIYETLVFGGIPSYYCNEIHLPIIEHEFKGETVPLERFFYYTHSKNSSSYFIINSPSNQYFLSSEMNKEYTKFIVWVFGSNNDSNLYLFIRNLPENSNSIEVTINNNHPDEIGSGGWYLLNLQLGEPLIVKVVCDGVETIREFSMTEDDKLGYFKKGFIKFN
jgi:hypothetical protein